MTNQASSSSIIGMFTEYNIKNLNEYSNELVIIGLITNKLNTLNINILGNKDNIVSSSNSLNLLSTIFNFYNNKFKVLSPYSDKPCFFKELSNQEKRRIEVYNVIINHYKGTPIELDEINKMLI